MKYEKLILISSGLGRFTANYVESFDSRLENDKRWSNRFLNEAWDKVVSDWNAQPIFLNSFEPVRYEEDYNKQALADSLIKWSQAHMKTEDQLFKMFNERIILVSGELDEKYTLMYQAVSKKFNIPHYVLNSGGHRLIFSHQEKIRQIILSALS